jgi:hypothetical protein
MVKLFIRRGFKYQDAFDGSLSLPSSGRAFVEGNEDGIHKVGIKRRRFGE